jgi:hypothetical protein
LGGPIGRGFLGRPATGCEPGRLPLHQGTAISRSGTVSPAGAKAQRRARGLIDNTDTIIGASDIGASDANGWRTVSQASFGATRASSTGAGPESGSPFGPRGSYSAGAPQATSAATVTSPECASPFIARDSRSAGAIRATSTATVTRPERSSSPFCAHGGRSADANGRCTVC